MNTCNYAWNITSLGFGRNTKIDFGIYKGGDEYFLLILGGIEYYSYGCNELNFTKKLTLKLAGFYTTPNFHTVAYIYFDSNLRKFKLMLFFKG